MNVKNGGGFAIPVQAPAPLPADELLSLREIDSFTEELLTQPEVEPRLRTICDFWVPARADWALVTLTEHPSGVLKIAAIAHRDAQRGNALLERLRGQPYKPQDRLFSSEASGEIALRLQFGDRHIGVLHLGIPPAEPVNAQLLERIASRSAVGLHNAQLFEQQRKIALSFQNAALTTELPRIEGLRFDAVYEAGQAEALVGGDWYDAFAVADGRIVLSVGDVAGSGLEAAVAMTSVRQAIRGVAQVHPDPAVMLAAAERTLRLQHKDLLVTAFVAVLDSVTQECAYANAGHPPPLLRTEDGAVRALRIGRPPLGLWEFGSRFIVHHAHVPPGSLLLLFTDGLTEATRDILEGESRLRAALEASDILVYDNVARRIHEVVLGQRSLDDVAILSVRIESAREVWRWRLDPMWADAAARVRTEIRAILAAEAFSAPHQTDFEVIFSELMSNMLRFAPGTAEVILEQHGEDFVLHVLDKGAGFLFVPQLPPDLFSESGRGLFLIANLSRDFSVVRRPGGGSHARVVLLQKDGATQ
ncbi:MAG: SpoIIE family protein phosphatase [Candidatus Baltobacteraceae bacterium]